MTNPYNKMRAKSRTKIPNIERWFSNEAKLRKASMLCSSSGMQKCSEISLVSFFCFFVSNAKELRAVF